MKLSRATSFKTPMILKRCWRKKLIEVVVKRLISIDIYKKKKSIADTNDKQSKTESKILKLNIKFIEKNCNDQIFRHTVLIFLNMNIFIFAKKICIVPIKITMASQNI